MAKLFFEVFPTLKITGEMSALLKETEITKVASNSAQNALRIYLESTRLIPKPCLLYTSCGSLLIVSYILQRFHGRTLHRKNCVKQ